MADATSRSGADGTRGEDRTGKGTGDPTGAYSPMATPTESATPATDPKAGRPATAPGRDGVRGTEDTPGGESGLRGGSVPGGDKASGFGSEAGGFGRDTEVPGRETARGQDAGSGAGARSASGHHETRLLPHDECDKLGMRLQHAVAGFVDEPRSAVEEADHVLEEAAARFADAVKQRRRTLRNSWQTGEGKAATAGDTEQLRLVLRDYRELTERLLHS
ncbi:hypothetical protein ACI2L1_36030 [Streptomyces sp. NPDC019531]|uniref:hypothetical protein n=1 Tax=Streptomyces sp. NPDC019531 TaxID=3365062 RepID=UPI00384E6007